MDDPTRAWTPADVWIPINPPIRSGQIKKRTIYRDKAGKQFAGMRQNPKYEAALEALSGVLFHARPYGWFPKEEAVRVEVRLYLPYLKSTPKRDRGKLLPITTTPDWDNVAKMYGDALTRGGWLVDDKWITRGSLWMRRSPIVGLRLLVIPDDTGEELADLHALAGLFAGKEKG